MQQNAKLLQSLLAYALSLTKRNIYKSGEGKARYVTTEEGKHLYGKEHVKRRLVLVILPLSQCLRAHMVIERKLGTIAVKRIVGTND